MNVQLVWFKRDLRIQDHLPMVRAAARGPCIFLYIYEPRMITAPDFDSSHLGFVNESLAELDIALRRRGAALTTRVGDAVEVFERLRQEYRFTTIWAHQETGNGLSYQRDLAVHEWAREHGVHFRELANNGVIRRLKNRDGWSSRWRTRMARPLAEPPDLFRVVDGLSSSGLKEPSFFGIPPDARTDRVKGGMDQAQGVLESFLQNRGAEYRSELSSPVTAFSGCSRLSAYLAFGNISMRQVVQATKTTVQQKKAAKKNGEATGDWLRSLRAFQSRLHWRDHFIQKLEDQPSLEFENQARACDGLREREFDRDRLVAWCKGETGYPMVDACMRALHRHGWINFRMRAMLVSFAAYHLWLHWREPAIFLARNFIDYEPGIHYPQIQMQSGVTGINAIRIYSPAKQVRDQDPQGVFIRRFLPELTGVPEKFLAEPHTMPESVQRSSGCVIGRDYPEPIVEHKTAYASARKRIFAVRGTSAAKSEAERIYQKHGSRRRPGGRSGNR